MRVVQAALFVFILRTASAIRCAPNSHFNSSASGCPVTCANKDFQRPCPIGCIPRCECNSGYVLDFRGRCIRECDCPPRCPPNSHFNPTGMACPKTCENRNVQISCTKGSIPRCECDPGYVLDIRGICISEADCPKCAPNSHFRYLAPGCSRTCANYKNPRPCSIPPLPRCVCNSGFVFDHLGNCIKESDCPVCPLNSFYDPMASGCPKTCDNKDLKITCDRPRSPSCICRPGYVLDQRGICIKECDCPKCPPNSHFNLTASECQDNCENKDDPTPCELGVKPMCECNDGFVLDINGNCIPEPECPRCRTNMRYSFCASACDRTCENKDLDIRCTLQCVPKCTCLPGFVFDHDGNCVSETDCPKCPPHAIYKFKASACPATCENPGAPSDCKKGHIRSCECKPGYVLDVKGNCVSECPKCQPNSVYKFKMTACPATCENPNSPKGCTKGFMAGCECLPGFVLDVNGVCVAKCPKCQPNSVYKFKVTACPATCENPKSPKECTKGFAPGCECLPGFALDVDGICTAKCPKCQPNSIYKFKVTACPATCENPTAPKTCTEGFIPGCECLPGFVLDSAGICVAKCPKCQPNAVYRFKVSACPATCENPNNPKKCSKDFIPGCECLPGFVLDVNGVCVAKCPKCQPNSVYKFMVPACPATCENPNNPKNCGKGFIPGCECLPGFLLDVNGVCVAKCPVCQPNSVYKFKVSACPANCENPNNPKECTKGFVPGCECLPGFMLDANAICTAKCPICQPNSVYKFKISACPATCENPNAPEDCKKAPISGCECLPGFVQNFEGVCVKECPKCQPNAVYRFKVSACPATCENQNAPKDCKKGFVPACECIPGFVLNRNGVCIPLNQCTKCPPNTIYKFKSSACQPTCENPERPLECKLGFRPSCECVPGFVLDHNGICVSECPKCPPNTIYKFKASACPATCEHPNRPLKCKLGFIPRCECVPGFVLDHNGVCIPLPDCPKCPPNTIFRFKASACPATCENPNQPLECSLGFKPGCECRPGFVLAHNGICIPLPECPKCPPNSRFRFNATSCLITCENRDVSRLCTTAPKPRCVCNPGFVRDHNGNCILAAACPKCPPNSAFRFKASGCPLTCETKDAPGRCLLPPKPSCECLPGFVLDHNERCIPVAACPRCPPNSFFKFNATACLITCENKDRPRFCNLGFRPRCVCRPGFVRDHNGNCILAAACPRCPPFSTFRFNATACLQTCENMHTHQPCLEGFKPRCQCNPGYVLNPSGNCIPAAACPKCPPNSIFKFNATACLKTCENKDIPRYCTLGFRPRCVCRPGFVRDINGVCILATLCPKCPPNAHFRFNATACLTTCENKDFAKKCALGFKPRCICNPGFVLDHNGVCVPAASCPKCPPNSIYQFKASNCLVTCENKDKPALCTLGFKPRCICKPGFVLDHNDQCILSAACPRCPPNSSFRFKAIACPLTCENIENPIKCVLPPKPRCMCNPGFVLDHIGNCIPVGACPKCPPNSFFKPNASACLITCENKNSPKLCTLGNKPRCVCKPGFVLNFEGICVLESSCPKCPPNSSFRYKASGCSLTCENKDDPMKCLAPPRPRCICNLGFVLDQNGNCIPASSCPKCPPNSRFRYNATACPINCENKDVPFKCDLGYKPRCECVPGFVLDFRGICIPVTNCIRCPANSMFQGNAPACVRTCENYEKKEECTLGTKSRCVCEPGFVIDVNGDCVPTAKCPRCGPNAHYQFCAPACPINCANKDRNIQCLKPCVPRCVCNPGHVLNYQGVCIPVGQCPNCGPNAIFNPTASACQKTCLNKDDARVCTLGVKPRCECVKGFVRDINGGCIRECDCPHCRDNSHYNEKASGCPNTCLNKNAEEKCTAPPSPRCECNEGFVLDSRGMCIKECDCPSCGSNSHFNPTASACPITCANKDHPVPCRLGTVGRCQCNRGYVLDNHGKCILECDCPPRYYYV